MSRPGPKPDTRPLDERVMSRITVTPEGHWLWGGYHYKEIHPIVCIRVDDKPKTIHLRSYFRGEYGGNYKADCGEPRCSNPEHCVPRDVQKRKTVKEKHSAEIRYLKALFIRRLYKKGYTEGEIASGIGMTIGGVSLIVHNKRGLKKEV